MDLELKNLKVHPDMSEETNCFSATIYANGKKAGEVRNAGQGGCNNYHWFDAALGQEIEQWANLQPSEFAIEKLDQIVDDLIAKTEVLKQLKRWTKRQTLFRLKGDQKREWRTVKAPYSPKVKAFVTNKYGKEIECIANDDLDIACSF